MSALTPGPARSDDAEFGTVEFSMESIRELHVALVALRARAAIYDVFLSEHMQWPIYATQALLSQYQHRLSERCAAWFEPQP